MAAGARQATSAQRGELLSVISAQNHALNKHAFSHPFFDHTQLSAMAAGARQATSAQRGELLSVISALEQESRQRADGLETAIRSNTREMQVCFCFNGRKRKRERDQDRERKGERFDPMLDQSHAMIEW